MSHWIRSDDELVWSGLGDHRPTRAHLPPESGRVPPRLRGAKKFQEDPHWKDHILFYEYFHGDNGAGLGASHQTGWTGVVAGLIRMPGFLDLKSALQAGKLGAFKAAKGGEIMKSKTSSNHPLIYQINTRVWLTELSKSLGRPATLDDIPDDEIDRLGKMGFE